MFVFLPMAFAFFTGRVKTVPLTLLQPQVKNIIVVPENNHSSPNWMFSEMWRCVNVSKYKVLKSLKGCGYGRCPNPPSPQK